MGRRKIVRRIIVLPDGTRKEVEEEVPAEEVDSDYDVIERDQVTSTVIPVDLDTSVGHPKPVERVHVTRVVRKPDGEEDVIDQSDSVFPLEPEEEAKEAVEEQEKDRHGMVIRRIVRRPVTVTSKRSVIRRIELLPDGGEKELEKSVEETAKEDDEPSKVRRIVHRYKTAPTGEKVPDEPEHVSPLECSTTEESDSEVDVKRVKGKEVRTISRRSISTSQKKIIRRVVESREGESDTPVEDTIEEPVETSKYKIVRKTIIGSDGKTEVVEEPHFELPEDAKVSVGEEKDDKGVVVRRIIRRPVPVITRRRVYRKVVLAPDGAEKGVEEKVLEPSEVDERVPVHDHHEPHPTAVVIEEQESIPPHLIEEDHHDEPRDEVITKREVHRTVVVPVDQQKTVDVIPSESEEEPSSDEVSQVRKIVTVRRKIVRRIIVLPDGSRKEIEEEVPSEETDSDFDVVEREEESSTEEVIAEPDVIEEQESTPDLPDFFRETPGEPMDEVVFRREVHRTVVVPAEKDK